MKYFLLAILLTCAVLTAANGQSRPVHTYSIVARDSATGQMGVAVQSHWFSVGALFNADPNWATLTPRLRQAGQLTADDAALRTIMEQQSK